MKIFSLLLILTALMLSDDGKKENEPVRIDYLPLQNDPSFRTLWTIGIGERHEADFLITGTLLQERNVLCLNAQMTGKRLTDHLNPIVNSRNRNSYAPFVKNSSETSYALGESLKTIKGSSADMSDGQEKSESLSDHLSRVAMQFHFSPIDLHADAWNKDKAGNSFSFTLLIPFSRRFEFGVSYSECTVDAYSSATTKYTCRSVSGQINALLSTGSFVPYAGVFAGHGTYDGDGDPGGMQAGAQFGFSKRFKSGFRIGTAVVYTKQSEKGWGGYMISVPLFVGFQFNP